MRSILLFATLLYSALAVSQTTNIPTFKVPRGMRGVDLIVPELAVKTGERADIIFVDGNTETAVLKNVTIINITTVKNSAVVSFAASPEKAERIYKLSNDLSPHQALLVRRSR